MLGGGLHAKDSSPDGGGRGSGITGDGHRWLIIEYEVVGSRIFAMEGDRHFHSAGGLRTQRFNNATFVLDHQRLAEQLGIALDENIHQMVDRYWRVVVGSGECGGGDCSGECPCESESSDRREEVPTALGLHGGSCRGGDEHAAQFSVTFA